MVHACALDHGRLRIDLRPGGIFRTVMRSPEGQEFTNLGCYLEVVEGERLVWTNALAPGFRPTSGRPTARCAEFAFTAIIPVRAAREGDEYSALVIHGDEETPQEARRDGLPGRLGQGARPARRAREDDVSGQRARGRLGSTMPKVHAGTRARNRGTAQSTSARTFDDRSRAEG